MLQRLLHALLTDRRSIRAVEGARRVYQQRRSALANALRTHGIEVGGSDGINIWVPVADETSAVARLAAQGIGVAPGSPFAVGPGHAPHIRVTAGLLADRYDTVAGAIAGAARSNNRAPV